MSTIASSSRMSKTTPTLESDDILLSDRDLPIEGNVAAQRSAPPAKRKRKIVFGVVALLLIVGGSVAVHYWIDSQKYESTDDATVEGRVIPISPQVAARVKAVYVADNAVVHKGQVMVELDATDFEVALEQAHASEAAAKGRLSQATAQVEAVRAARDQARAELTVAESNAQMASADHDRYEDAARRNAGAISKQQLDTAAAAWKSTEAQVQQARAKLAAGEAQIAFAQAAVIGAQGDLAKAAADVHRADVNLSYCTLTASEDGRVTKKNVEPGSYVQTGQSLFAIVPQDYWVVANFKETQLDRVRIGQGVNISIDAYPEKQFTGRIESVQSGTGSRFSVLPAENATGNYVKVVQRVPVKIVFDADQTKDEAHPLAPGMSAVPVVKVR